MKVKDLIKILQGKDQEAEVAIAQSTSNWDEVLVVMEDPSNPDNVTEIRCD